MEVPSPIAQLERCQDAVAQLVSNRTSKLPLSSARVSQKHSRRLTVHPAVCASGRPVQSTCAASRAQAVHVQESDKAAVKEAALLSKLNSPNVIGYRDSFFEKKQLHIVTEFCENGDLFTEIRGRKANGQMYTEDEIMETFVMVASGLHHIHASKILHRDLKCAPPL